MPSGLHPPHAAALLASEQASAGSANGWEGCKSGHDGAAYLNRVGSYPPPPTGDRSSSPSTLDETQVSSAGQESHAASCTLQHAKATRVCAQNMLNARHRELSYLFFESDCAC
jgi:hypothetical protein